MTTTATVSDKGQVTQPKPLRDQLGIRPGSRLEFVVGVDGVVQLKVLATGSTALVGPLARPAEAARSLSEHEPAVTEIVRAQAKGRR